MGVFTFCILGYLIFFYLELDMVNDTISNNLAFDKKVWKNGTIRQRGQMVNYLIDSIKIKNLSQEKIISLMGEPDDRIKINNNEFPERFYYSLDKGHKYKYDMIIFFDNSKKVSDILFDD